MKKFLLLFALLSANFISFSQNNYESNQVIVLLKGSANIDHVLQFFNGTSTDIQLELNRTLSKHSHIYLLEFDSLLATVPLVISQLKDDERVVFAQPNHNNIEMRTTIPNDLEYPVQWSLQSSATARVFAPEAWDITTDGLTDSGDTIVMAVVDGGVDIQHIDLNLFKNRHEIPNNGIDDDNNGYVDDYDGWNAYTQSGVITSNDHGTHIAGIIGAKTNNNEGIAGIVWDGKVLPINASSGIESVVVEGYGYALELRSTYNRTNGDSGAFVVATNSSFGLDRENPADYPIWCAFYDSLGAAGILNMTATTNSGLDVDAVGDIPTTCPSDFVVAVSNINENGNLLGGYGATQIDLAAPGTDIRSTIPGHNYGYKTGTSMATPHVVGVVGAMYSAMCGFDQSVFLTHPDSIALWVKQSLLESVDSVPNLIGKNSTNGRLNMYKAVRSMLTVNVTSSTNKVLESSVNANDGEITVTPTGGTLPYSFIWSNNETTATISNLTSGTYSVTITEKYGCTETNDIDLWTVGLEELSNSNPFIISPNPNQGTFLITFQKELDQDNTLQIYDAVGQLVLEKNVSTISNQLEIQTNLKAGIYIVRINNRNSQHIVIR